MVLQKYSNLMQVLCSEEILYFVKCVPQLIDTTFSINSFNGHTVNTKLGSFTGKQASSSAS